MSNVSPEQFIAACEASDSRAEVAERTGLTTAAVTSRLRAYRIRGIKLKHVKGAGKEAVPVSSRRLRFELAAMAINR